MPVFDPAAVRYEFVCEAIAPDGDRARVGAFRVPSVCLRCGRPPAYLRDGDVVVEGTSMVTINNQPGMLCRPCTISEMNVTWLRR